MRRPGRLRRGSDKLGHLLLGMSLFGALACGRADLPPEPADSAPPTVRVFIAEEGVYHLETKAWGRLRPGVETRLSAQVAGVVTRVSSRLYPGEIIAAGDSLARIDPRDYQLAVVQLEASLAAAELHWHQERAEAQAAEAEWQARRALDTAEAEASPHHELATRRPQLKAAEARLEAARAALEKARLDLSRTQLTAPYSAWITARLVEPGQYLRVGDPIAELQSTEFLEARLPVSSRHLKWIERNPKEARVVLSPQDQPESAVLGIAQPERIEPQIDPETGLGHLVVRLVPETRPDGTPLNPLARAGALVAARIVLEQPRRGFWIPRAALLAESSVLVLGQAGALERRDIQIGADRDTWLAVSSGLQDGDRVCYSPPSWATDGMLIEPLPMDTEDLYALVGSRPPAALEPFESSAVAPNSELLADPLDAHPEPTPHISQGQSTLTTWSVDQDGETLRVHVSGDRIGDPQLFALEQPHRWVADLRGSSWPHAPDVEILDAGPFRRARLAQFNHDPPIARVVIELDRAIPPPVIEVGPQGVVIVFGAPP